MGRPAGSPNKATEELKAKCAELGVDLFEYLLYYVKGDYISLGIKKKRLKLEHRLKATIEAIQYIHSKKRMVSLDVEGINITAEDYTRDDRAKDKTTA